MNEIVRLTLMPIIAAASLSWATARIALPDLVRCTSQTSASSVGIVTTKTISWFHVMDASPMEKILLFGRMSSRIETGAGPFQTRPTVWRMNETPIAVISGASRGALRSGR